jgi:hypothetical protein
LPLAATVGLCGGDGRERVAGVTGLLAARRTGGHEQGVAVAGGQRPDRLAGWSRGVGRAVVGHHERRFEPRGLGPHRQRHGLGVFAVAALDGHDQAVVPAAGGEGRPGLPVDGEHPGVAWSAAVHRVERGAAVAA